MGPSLSKGTSIRLSSKEEDKYKRQLLLNGKGGRKKCLPHEIEKQGPSFGSKIFD